jgi:shikimate dehydrogenase
MADALTFRLLGHGIAYSASPAMMNAAFDALGLPHRYVLADVAAADVPATVAGLRAADAGGANVTVPHKAAVAALVDAVTDVAREADAVNTVVREGDRLVGHNTDMPATIEAIERLRPDGVGHALILGAGGVSRAVQLALRTVGVERTTVLRRSDGSMGRLADEIVTADLLVNATPVGTGINPEGRAVKSTTGVASLL